MLTEIIVGFFEFIWLFLVAIFNLIKSLILFPIYQPAEAFSLIALIVAFFVGFLLPFKFLPEGTFGMGGPGDLEDGFLINLGRYIIALVVFSVAGLCGVGLVFVAGNLLEFIGLY